MKQQFFKKQIVRNPESGIYVVLLALMVGMLIMAGGLLIESANLYRTETRLARAARAGAMAGVSYVLTHGWFYINRGDFWSDQQNIATLTPINQQFPAGGAALQPLPASNPISRQNTLRDRVREVVVNNLFDAGMDVGNNTSPLSGNGTYGQLTIDVNYNPVIDQVTVQLVYNQQQIFLPEYLPGFVGPIGCTKRLCPVTATSVATRNPATIALVLDTSGSMGCPAAAGQNCNCRSQPGGCPANTSIMMNLKQSVQSFISYFNPFLDRIAIVPYNLAADPNYARFRRDNNGQLVGFGSQSAFWDTGAQTRAAAGSPIAIRDMIRTLTPLGNTNPCDGILTAINELGDANITAQDNPAIILFTDGAPNAARISPTSPADNRLNGANSTNDWYLYTLEWAGGLLGPSPLINCRGGRCLLDPTQPATPQSNLFNFQIGLDPDGKEGPQPPMVYPAPANNYIAREEIPAAGDNSDTNIVCGATRNVPADYQQVLNAVLPGQTGQNNTGCLVNHLGFSLPGVTSEPNRFITGSSDLTFADYVGINANNPFDYEQIPYHCTIRAADQARTQFGANVYAIGLGNRPSQGATPRPDRCLDVSGLSGDPYQDVSDHMSRKDIFLARVALDPISRIQENNFSFSTRRPINISGTCPNHSRSANGYNGQFFVGSAGVRPAADRTLRNRNGAYFPAANASELPDYFAQIAKQILLRQSQ